MKSWKWGQIACFGFGGGILLAPSVHAVLSNSVSVDYGAGQVSVGTVFLVAGVVLRAIDAFASGKRPKD